MIQNKTELLKNKIIEIYPRNYESILSSLEIGRFETFRINSEKSSTLTFLEDEGYEIIKGPVVGSYVNKNTKLKLSQSKLFKEHKIYIQSLNSMLPALVLNPINKDTVLDMCAAPGSKTSQLAQLAGVPQNITAVENNTNRFFGLKKNLAEQGFEQVKTIRANASILPKILGTEIFDKVLLDAPCSNEGTFRLLKNENLDSWHPKSSKGLPQLQKKLLAVAVNLVKPGGKIVYSTCTYEPGENEAILDWALKKFKNIRILPISQLLPDIPLAPGFQSFKNHKFDFQVTNAVRILPSQLFDGFFIGLFEKELD